MTSKIYQHQGELRELVTKVLSFQAAASLPDQERGLLKQISDEDHVVVTDATIFHAQGGGQPSDTGHMEFLDTQTNTEFHVSSARHGPEGRVLHFGRFADTAGPPAFQAGDKVRQSVDTAKRNLHSRLHTAGHILSLAVRHTSEIETDVTELKASHYPDAAFVDFRGLIDGKHKDAIQSKTNYIVQQALPVKVHWWTEAEVNAQCVGLPERFKVPDGNELARVVEIEGLGAYPCGGTHVEDTSKVGGIEVRKISRSKGVSKISYKML